MINKRKVGERFEGKACEYMAARGFRVLERNFRCRQGEVDVVGEDGGYLVFVEVKYRAAKAGGSPAEAVTAAKQRKICRTADYYRCRHGIGDDRAVRYDVVAIEGTDSERGKKRGGKEEEEEALKIVWYKNAFFHVYAGRRL